jgi:hypothetical protein
METIFCEVWPQFAPTKDGKRSGKAEKGEEEKNGYRNDAHIRHL